MLTIPKNNDNYNKIIYKICTYLADDSMSSICIDCCQGLGSRSIIGVTSSIMTTGANLTSSAMRPFHMKGHSKFTRISIMARVVVTTGASMQYIFCFVLYRSGVFYQFKIIYQIFDIGDLID